MNEERIIQAANEEEVWKRLNMDLQDTDLLHYKAAIEQGGKKVYLDIDIDLGGGFESGYSTTTLIAPLSAAEGFKFAIHPKHFTDDIGKFFGMQDVVIGYPDFDEKFIIKTNDEVKVKALFADSAIRKELIALPDFTFEITTEKNSEDDEKHCVLQLFIEEAINQPAQLRSVYHMFMQVLILLEGR